MARSTGTEHRKLVAFDYDGVLVDSLDHNLSLAEEAARHVGHPRCPNRADVEQLDNMSFEDIARLIQVPEERVDDFAGYVYRRLYEGSDAIEVFPGIARLLATLSSRHLLLVITANAQGAASRLLGSVGLLAHFDTVLGAETPGSKAEKLSEAAKRLGVPPGRVYMVGDSVSDIRQAKLAGVTSIAVTWGYHSETKLARESPDFLVRIPQEIAEAVDHEQTSALGLRSIDRL